MVDADKRADAKQALPYVGELDLQGIPGLDEKALRTRRPWRSGRPEQPELLGQGPALIFPGRTRRDRGDDDEPTRHLELGEAGGDEFADRLLRSPGAFSQHDGRGDVLPQGSMRDRKGHGPRDGRVVQEYLVHLHRRDLHSAPVNELLDPPGDEQVAVLVE